MTIRIYVDSEGTISRKDVGNAFFRRFGGEGCVAAVRDYRDGRISAQECFRREAALIGELEAEEANAFLDQQEIDETFIDFVRYSREQGYPVTIVTDGLEYYIRRLLGRHGLEAVEVFANTLSLGPPHHGGRSAVSLLLPYADAECDRCACCKRNILLTRSAEKDLIVFIGEGYADRCPARFADIVFARNELQTFCQRENISYYLYSSFGDVISRLELLRKHGPLHQRRRAVQERRQTFLQG